MSPRAFSVSPESTESGLTLVRSQRYLKVGARRGYADVFEKSSHSRQLYTAARGERRPVHSAQVAVLWPAINRLGLSNLGFLRLQPYPNERLSER